VRSFSSQASNPGRAISSLQSLMPTTSRRLAARRSQRKSRAEAQ
jgi:hypothetical protein